MHVTTVRDLASVLDDSRWPVLLGQDPQASAFQGPQWLTAWAEHRSTGDIVVRLFERDGELRGLVAEVDEGDGVHTLIGGTDVTDYRGPVAAEDDRKAVAVAWLDELVRDGVTRLRLHGIASDTGWLDHLQEAAGAPWQLVDRELEDVCPCVDLQGDGPDGWLGRIDGKERHELRRKARKLARDLGGMAVVEVPTSELQDGLSRFWTLAVTAEGDKGAFFRDDDMRTFFDAVVATMGPDGTLRMHELMVGGLPAASMISIVKGDVWGLYNSALDETLAAFAPGTVLAAELASLAAAEGFTVFDFLRGDEAYKYRFGAVDRPIERAQLVRG